jgi:hypothetical protein
MSIPEQHHIHIGPDGTFTASGDYTTTNNQIDQLFTKMKEKNCHHIILYFHGGMVPEASGTQTAYDLSPVFEKDGAQPIFFIWETGWDETILQNINKFWQSEFIQELLKHVILQAEKILNSTDGGKGFGTVMSMTDVEEELKRDFPFENRDIGNEVDEGAKSGVAFINENELPIFRKEIEKDLLHQMQTRSNKIQAAVLASAKDELITDEVRQQFPSEGEKGVDWLWLAGLAAKIVIQTVRRYLKGLDHGFYPTIIEETFRATSIVEKLGKFLWNQMKAKAAAMWETDSKNPRIGAYFLDQLISYAKSTPGFKIDLAGHSAGSIVICEMLKAAATKSHNFQFGRIALLAPAVRMDLFVREVVQHPERFEELRIYTMKDLQERKDALLWKVYPISLVFFVSALLEDPAPAPLCGLARCLTGLFPYDSGDAFLAHKYLISGSQKLVLSVTNENAPPGFRSNACHHGDFDNVKMSDGKPGETINSLQFYFKR